MVIKLNSGMIFGLGIVPQSAILGRVMIGAGRPAQIWAGQRTTTRFIPMQPLDLVLSTRVVFFLRTAREMEVHTLPRTYHRPSLTAVVAVPKELWRGPARGHRSVRVPQQIQTPVPAKIVDGPNMGARRLQLLCLVLPARRSGGSSNFINGDGNSGRSRMPRGVAAWPCWMRSRARPSATPIPLDALDGPSSQAAESDGAASPATWWPRSEKQRWQPTAVVAGPMGRKDG